MKTTHMTRNEVQRIVEAKWSSKLQSLDRERLAALWNEVVQEPISVVGERFEVLPPKALRTQTHSHLSTEQREHIWNRFCEIQAAGDGDEIGYGGIAIHDTRTIGLVHWHDDIDTLIDIVGAWEPFRLPFDPDTGELETVAETEKTL